MTTVAKTKAGFRIETKEGKASFTIGAYGSNTEHDVTRFDDGAHVWTVSAIDKLRALAIIGPNAGFAEAGPKLMPILIGAGIIPRPAAPAAASPSPAPAASPTPTAAPKATTPAIATVTGPAPKPPAGPSADSPEAVAERINGKRPSPQNEAAAAAYGWDPIVAALNRKPRT